VTGHDSSSLEAWREELVAALRGDAGEPEPSPAPAAATPTKLEVLAFELNGEIYAVDIQEVAEILLARTPTPVPRAPPFVLGVVTLRGSVLPVIELGQRLGLPPSESSKRARIVVLRDGEERMGFWVGRVRGVIRFSPDEVEATGFASAVDPRFLKGIGYDRGGNLVAVLLGERLCDFSLEDPEPGAGSGTRGDPGGDSRRPGPEADPMPDRLAAVAAGGGGDDQAAEEPPTSMVG
jgi:purine-binding chemotaxis protein CheW